MIANALFIYLRGMGYYDNDSFGERILGTLGLCAVFGLFYGLFRLGSYVWAWAGAHWPW